MVATRTPWLRILLVEDERLLRWAIMETLVPWGLAVHEAADGATAIHALRAATQPFDVVLLNHPLPDVPDLTLLKTLRCIAPISPVVFMPTFRSSDLVFEARKMGVVGVLPKPFDLTRLTRAVVDAAGW